MNSTADSPSGNRIAITGIVAVSAVASAFLIWLLYVHRASGEYAGTLTFLPALNSLFNALSAISLCTGFALIKRKDRRGHKRAMLTAFVFSSLFLVSYIVHHALHGDTHFPNIGAIRTVYLTILASHILLSIIALPFVLITFFFSLSGRFRQHKKIAKYTFPIWLYVSVTGVIVFGMLSAYTH
jgi:putative membrane protein